MMNKIIPAALALLLAIPAPLPVFAQYPPDDFLEEDDFGPPPPPPPPPPPGGDQPTFGGQPQDNNPPAGGGEANPSFGAKKQRQQKVPLKDARPDEITSENYPDLVDSFDFPNAEISDIVKVISELTGKNFIIDPSVRGKITIMAPTQITVAEAYKAFLSALAINGFTVVPSGKFWKIKNARLAQKDSIETYSGAYAPDTDQMITRIIHLKHISASEVNKSFRGITSKDGDLQVYEPTNSLIISDYGSNIDHINAILKELDIAGFEEQMEMIPIKYARAKDIADTMDKIINKDKAKGAGQRGFSSGIPRFGSTSASPSSADAFSLVIPDDRTNSVIVVGNKAGIDKIRKLVARLDRKIRTEDAGGVNVYYVKYGDAEKIAQTLQGLAQDAKKTATTTPPPGGAAPVEQNQPIFGGDVKVVANKDTNSLLVTAAKQDYQVVLSILRKIDIARDQVYVEAIIMEMGANNGSSYGITYYQFNKDSGGIGRGGFSSGNLSNLLNPAADKGLILPFASGETFNFKTPAGEIPVTTTLGFINLLKTVSSVNILSQPQILATDNEEALIEVGDKIPVAPVTTNTASGSQTSISFEEAKISLKLTPHISRTDGNIRMSIEQQVSQPTTQQVQAKNLADSAVSISKRLIKTNIVIRDGDTAVLGGLMKENEIEEVTKVPILGDIPILGWLFKSKTSNKTKQNLLVFLTPRVIRTKVDQVRLLDNKLNDRVDFIRRNLGGRDPFGTTVEPVHKKAEAELIQAEDRAGVEGQKEEEIKSDN